MKKIIGAILISVFAAAIWQVLAAAGGLAKEDTVEGFIESHWRHPIAPQGNPPAHFSPLEASLGADSCAACHAEQHRDWKESLHRQALGPGIRWQLRLMDQGQANRCLRCHAPLAEQKALLALEHGWPNAPATASPAHVPANLGHQGITCASCHVRDHQRFGPPPRKAPRPEAHGGFQVRAAYEDSRFCATCHQFPDDGPRINGKLQEDTLAQWRASPWAQKKTCQQCHMPDRRHEFRGIHDPQMVRKAVKVELELVETAAGPEARATVANAGAGHHFPTYMVPKVYLDLALVGPDGQREPLARRIIGWQVDTAITREIADTRIPAGERIGLRQPFRRPDGEGWAVEATLSVAPREHYERVYETALQQADRMDGQTLQLLREALEEARNSRFQAVVTRTPIGEGVR